MANFLVKFPIFRYHGNKGISEPNVTGIVELADPENHTNGTKNYDSILYTTGVIAV